MMTDRRTALVTGASSGIGLDLAKLFAADGHDLLLVARSADKLEMLANALRSTYNVHATAIPIDLTDPAAPDELFHLIAERGITVDFLVNNAGFGTHGPFAQARLDDELRMIQLNVAALTHLTHLFLPRMISQKSGRILNVASTAAFQPGPLMAIYYASKAFVLSFGEALDAELKGSGVTVTTLCPGPTETDFQRRAGISQTPMFRANTMSSVKVAEIGYRAMMRGKCLAIPGFKNKFLAMSVRFAPRKLVTAIAKKLNSNR
jgi:hypothetical protein